MEFLICFYSFMWLEWLVEHKSQLAKFTDGLLAGSLMIRVGAQMSSTESYWRCLDSKCVTPFLPPALLQNLSYGAILTPSWAGTAVPALTQSLANCHNVWLRVLTTLTQGSILNCAGTGMLSSGAGRSLHGARACSSPCPGVGTSRPYGLLWSAPAIYWFW